MTFLEALENIYSKSSGVVLWTDNCSSYWTDLSTEIGNAAEAEDQLGAGKPYDIQERKWGWIIFPKANSEPDQKIYLYKPSWYGLKRWIKDHPDRYPEIWMQLPLSKWIR